jgi:hypothetical protein
VNLDRGLILFDTYDWQDELLIKFQKYSKNIANISRQSGKTTTCVAFLLHSILFKKNYRVAVVANKLAMAKEIISRLKESYMYLPKWMQQGTAVWNAQSIELENGSKVCCDGTAAGSLRGNSFNLVLMDEFAHIPDHLLNDFFSSVYPTIVSGKTAKLIIISTPCGMNLFHKIWIDSVNGRNQYIPTQVHWSQIPGRDEQWKADTIANTNARQFAQEFESLAFDTNIDIEKYMSLNNFSKSGINNVRIKTTLGNLYNELKQANEAATGT